MNCASVSVASCIYEMHYAAWPFTAGRSFCTMSGKFHFAIDRGGTFTDIWCRLPNGSVRQMKLLSEDPKNYKDAPREGIRRIMEEVEQYENFLN